MKSNQNELPKQNDGSNTNTLRYRLQLNKVLFATILLIPLLLLIIYGPNSAFSLLIAFITFAAFREFYVLVNGTTNYFSGDIIFGCLIGSGITLTFTLRPELQGIAILAGVLAALVFEVHSALASEPNASILRFSSFLAGWFYIAFPLGYIIRLRLQPDGIEFVLSLLVLGMVSSISAGYIGRLFGRTHFPKSVNANKTLEGAISGVFVTGLAFVLINHFTLMISTGILWQLILGLLLGAVAQIGDLGKSVLKRLAGVADSGTFIPAVGGVLDLVDSYLLLAPLFYLILFLS